MPIVKTYPKSDLTNWGYGAVKNWEVTQDTALHDLARDLQEQGWDVRYRYSFAKVRTTTDISSFSGTGTEPFYQVVPPKEGSTALRKLIIDHVPSGYTPSPGYEIFAVTGSLDKSVVHAAVIACMQAMSEKGTFATLGPIGSGDPDDPLPNTIVCWKEYAADEFVPGNPLHRKVLSDELGAPNYTLPQPAVGLNTTAPELSNGGYACKCSPNGDESNYISVFLHRNSVGGIQPFQPAFTFFKDVPSQPNIPDAVAGTDCSFELTLDYTRCNFRVAIGPHHFHGAEISNGRNGHIQVAALDLPVSDSTLIEACFAIGNSTAGIQRTFRNGIELASAGNNAALFRNGIYYYRSDGVTPRLVSNWGAIQSNGHRWFGGLHQDIETWVSFTVAAGSSAAAPVVGKLPDAITIEGSFDADAMHSFTWDNKTYTMFTRNATAINSMIGSVAFIDDEATNISPLDCTP